MKKLLMIIFIPLGFILAIPLTFLVIMYDGSSWEDFDKSIYHEDADALTLFYEDLDAALDDYHANAEADEDLIIPLHQDVLNTFIFTLLQAENEDYLPNDSCEETECLYVFEDRSGSNFVYRVKGAWVTFEASSGGQLYFNLALEAGRAEGFTFKTVIQARFDVEDSEEEFYVAFDRVRIGSMPLTSGFFSRILSTANVSSNLEEDDYEGIDFNQDDLSLTIHKSDFLASLEAEDDALADLMIELLDIVFERRLLYFNIREQVMDLTLGIAQIRSDDDSDIPEYLYDLHDEEGYNPDKFDSQQFMKTRFDQYTFNRALTGDTRYEIREKHFNKMLYDSFEGFESLRFTRMVNDRQISVGLQGLWFDFGDEDIKVNGLVEIDSIKSMIDMTLEAIDIEDDRIEYQLTRLAIGDAQGKSEEDFILIDDQNSPERLDKFRSAFGSFGDVGFAQFSEEGSLIISTETLEDFMEGGTVEDNIRIESFEINDRGILLDLQASNEDLDLVLSAFSQSLNNVFTSPTILSNLESELNPEAGSAEQNVIDSVSAIQDVLDQDGEVDSSMVDDLFEAYEQMSGDNQAAFMDTFNSEMDETIVDEFKDFFQN